MSIEKLYSVREVADLLSIHSDNVYNMIKRGEMYAIRLGPRRTRIPESALREWMEARKAEHS